MLKTIRFGCKKKVLLNFHLLLNITNTVEKHLGYIITSFGNIVLSQSWICGCINKDKNAEDWKKNQACFFDINLGETIEFRHQSDPMWNSWDSTAQQGVPLLGNDISMWISAHGASIHMERTEMCSALCADRWTVSCWVTLTERTRR